MRGSDRGALTCRVFVAHGARDPIVGIDDALRVTKETQGPLRVEILPEAGHFVPEEAGPELAGALVDWLR